MNITDKIVKQVTIKASVSRVWRAITDAKEFSKWFGVELHGAFVAGGEIRGTFRGDFDEAAIMEYQRKAGVEPTPIRELEDNLVFCTVEKIEPERYFSFRWIPYGIDVEVDPKNEPTTLVEFHLEKAGDGTLLTITESGFDRVPAKRRERAFRMNDGGWAAQAENVKAYVEGK